MLMSAGQIIAAAWADVEQGGVMVEFVDVRSGLTYKRIIVATLQAAEEIGRRELKREGAWAVSVRCTLPNGEIVHVV